MRTVCSMKVLSLAIGCGMFAVGCGGTDKGAEAGTDDLTQSGEATRLFSADSRRTQTNTVSNAFAGFVFNFLPEDDWTSKRCYVGPVEGVCDAIASEAENAAESVYSVEVGSCEVAGGTATVTYRSRNLHVEDADGYLTETTEVERCSKVREMGDEFVVMSLAYNSGEDVITEVGLGFLDSALGGGLPAASSTCFVGSAETLCDTLKLDIEAVNLAMDEQGGEEVITFTSCKLQDADGKKEAVLNYTLWNAFDNDLPRTRTVGECVATNG